MLFGPSPVRFWDVHVSGYIRMWGLRHLGLRNARARGFEVSESSGQTWTKPRNVAAYAA